MDLNHLQIRLENENKNKIQVLDTSGSHKKSQKIQTEKSIDVNNSSKLQG